jgi:cell division protein FtsB
MTTHTKGPLPGTAPGGSRPPDRTPGRVVTRRTAVVVGALVALLVGVLSAAGATYVAGGQAGELEGSVDTLTAQVDSLTTEVDDLTAEAGTLTARIEGLVAEKADLADTLTGTRAQAESLAAENAALRTQVGDLAGQRPVVADVAYGKVLKVDRWWLKGNAFVLIVDVTATNPAADEEAYLSRNDFRLKGLDDTLYLPADDSPVASERGYREWVDRLSRSRLTYLELAPSETAKVSLLFYVNKAVSRFTITYGGTTTALTL